MTGSRPIKTRTKAGRFRPIAALAVTLAAALFASPSAFAACSSPVGNPGDIGYSSVQNVMVYCNGSTWVNMGGAGVGFGGLTTGDFCTATSSTAISCATATINLATQASGILQAGQFPALSGDVTTSAGSLTTSIGANKVTMGDIAQIAGLSVIGNSGSSSGNVGAITGTANQALVVNSAGTGLAFGALNLSSSAAVTGTLLATQEPAHTGDVTNSAGSLVLTVGKIGGNVVSLGGALTTGGAFTVSGGALTLTVTGTSSLTLPTSGTLIAGSSTPAQGDILYYNGTNWVDLAAGSGGYFLETEGASNNPQWAPVSVSTSSLSGTVGAGQGGTGDTSLTAHAVMIGEGSSAVGTAGPGTAGQLLVGQSATADPAFETVGGDLTMTALGSAAVAKIQGTTVSGVTGSGNVVFSASPTISGTVTLSGLNSVGVVTTNGSGVLATNSTLPAGEFPGLTGDVTASGGSISTTVSKIGGNSVTLGGAFTTTGSITLTSSGSNVTLPSSGTLLSTTSTIGTAQITGTLSVGQGGTGANSLTAYGVLVGNGTGAVASAGPGGVGTVLIGNGSSANPSFSASPSVTNLTMAGVETITPGTDYTTTGPQSDVAISDNSAIRYGTVAAGSATFYGIVAGTSGQILYLHNASSYPLTLSNQSGSEATAINRIITGTGSDLVMAANSSATLQYDNVGGGVTGRWRVIGGSGSGTATPAGTTGQVQFNSGSNTLAASGNLFWDNTNNRLGVGSSTAPVNALDVYGGTAVGTSYAGVTGAPANGLIVLGSTGVGVASPQSKLDVAGGAAIGTSYAGVTAAPANGLTVQGESGFGTPSPTSGALLEIDTPSGLQGPGTVAVTSGGTTVTGTGTTFLNSFQNGDQITANGETHTIAGVAATTLTTDAWTNAASGVAYTIVPGPVASGAQQQRFLVQQNGEVNIGGGVNNGNGAPSLLWISKAFVNNVPAGGNFISGIRMPISLGNTTGPFISEFNGVYTYPSVASTNTQNWTSNPGLNGVYANASVANGATGTITNINGIYVNVSNGNSATVSTAYGVRLNGISNGATMTSAAGIAAGAITAATNNTQLLLGGTAIPTGNYGIYDSSTYQNYFAGNVGIGTANPATAFEVYGLGGGGAYMSFGGSGTGYTNTSGPILELTGYYNTGSAPYTPYGIFVDNSGVLRIQQNGGTGNSIAIGGNGAVNIPGNVAIGTTSAADALDVYAGGIHMGNSTPGSTANALYAVGTSLYWNGAAVTAGGGGSSNLGTAVTAANPAATGQPGTGFYSAGTGLVDVAIGSNQIIEWSSGGENIVSGSLNLGGQNGISYPLDFTPDASIAIGSSALNYQTAGTTVQGNTAVGYQTLSSASISTSAIHNTAVGYQALLSDTTGKQNTAFGYQALTLGTSGNNNTAVGYLALGSTVSVNNVVAIGNSAGYSSTDSSSVFVGPSAGYSSSGSDNVFLGNFSGYKNTTGLRNVYIGYATNYDVNAVGTGSFNTFIGDEAGRNSQNNYATFLGARSGYSSIGSNMVAAGYESLFGASGNNNIAIGYQAGYTVGSGGYNIIIDSNGSTSAGITTGSNNIVIGSSLTLPTATNSNQLDIGNLIFATGLGSGNMISVGSVGIGTAAPASSLDVNGAIDISEVNGISFPADATATGASVAIGPGALVQQPSLTSTAFNNTAVGYKALGSSGLTATATQNTAVGYRALAGNTSGAANTAVGWETMQNNTSTNYNTALGYYALQNNAGNYNTGVGVDTLYQNLGGAANTASGYSALANNTSGSNNVATGYSALAGNISGNYNVAYGEDALQTNTTGQQNIAVGQQALQDNSVSNNNTAVGLAALYQATGNVSNGAGNNTALGYYAGANVTSGTYNILIGSYDSVTGGVTTGTNNILVGYDVRPPSPTASNQLNIGNLIYATGIGSSGTISVGSVGIGSSSPGASLTVAGNEAVNFSVNYATTGTHSDVALNAGTSVRYTGTATATFNGIVAGAPGQILYLHNGSAYPLTLANLSGSEATAPNQIVTGTGSNLGLPANSAVTLQYDNTATNTVGATGAWRVIGGSATSSTLGISAATPYLASSYDSTSGLFSSTSGAVSVSGSGSEIARFTANGLAVGTSYVGSAAPTNGVIVQGNVGIGTATPAASLDVEGGSTILNGSITAGAPGATIYVNGSAGVPNYSGSYAVSGTYNGYNYYKNQTGPGYIWYLGSYWIISASVGSQTNDFYYAGSASVPPLASGWTSQVGATGTSATTSTNILLGGNVGIGTTSPLGTLDVEGSGNVFLNSGTVVIGSSAAIALAVPALQLVETYTNPSAARGVSSTPVAVMTSGANSGTFAGIYSQPSIGSANNQNWSNTGVALAGVYGRPTITSGASGTISNVAGLFAQVLNSSAAATVTNAYGVDVQTITNSGTMTGAAGVAVQNITAATNNTELLLGTLTIPTGNYGVYDSSTYNNYFAGNVGIATASPASTLSVYGGAAIGTTYAGSNAAATNNLIVQGSVGIGTVTPASTLDVTGGGIHIGTSGIGGTAVLWNNAGTLTWGSTGLTVGGSVTASGGTGYFPYFTSGTTLGDSILFETGSTLGVNVTSPWATLDAWDTTSTTKAAVIRRGVQGADSSMVTAYGTPYLEIGGTEYKTSSIQTIGFGFNQASGTTYQPAEIGFQTTNIAGYTLGDIVFANRSVTTNTAPTEVLRIQSSGKIGVGSASPVVSLDLSQKTDAVALPAGATGAEPSSPVVGMIRYNTTNNAFEGYQGATPGWSSLGAGGGSAYLGTATAYTNLSRSGDTSTGFYTAGSGLVDVSILNSQMIEWSNTGENIVNGSLKLAGVNGLSYPIDFTLDSSIAIGSNALASQTIGTQTQGNIAIGYQALGSNTSGYGSVAIGYKALGSSGLTTAAVQNTAVGYQALGANTSGTTNAAFGYQALTLDTTGSANTSSGYQALGSTTTGSNNTANGYQALRYQTTGANNVALGYQAGLGTSASAPGNSTFVGYEAGYGITTGTNNTTLGYQAGHDLTTGNDNVIIGYYPTTAVGITTGGDNILIGDNLQLLAQTGAFQLDIGNLIFGTGLGVGTTMSVGNIGIQTTTPQSTLSVNGGAAIGTSYAANNAAPSSGLIVQGSVGIGTTLPATPLDVNGGGIHIGSSGIGGSNVLWNNAGTLSWGSTGLTLSGSVTAGGSPGYIPYFTSVAALGPSVLFQSGSDIGIGVVTPKSALDVDGGVTIGTSYAGVTAAPANGAIVQGNVAIGTNTSTGAVLTTNAGSNTTQVETVYNSPTNSQVYVLGQDNEDLITVGTTIGIGTTVGEPTAVQFTQTVINPASAAPAMTLYGHYNRMDVPATNSFNAGGTLVGTEDLVLDYANPGASGNLEGNITEALYYGTGTRSTIIGIETVAGLLNYNATAQTATVGSIEAGYFIAEDTSVNGTAASFFPLRSQISNSGTITGSTYDLYMSDSSTGTVAGSVYGIFDSLSQTKAVAGSVFAMDSSVTIGSNVGGAVYNLYGALSVAGNVGNVYSGLVNSNSVTGNVANTYTGLANSNSVGGTVGSYFYGLQNSNSVTGNITYGYYGIQSINYNYGNVGSGVQVLENDFYNASTATITGGVIGINDIFQWNYGTVNGTSYGLYIYGYGQGSPGGGTWGPAYDVFAQDTTAMNYLGGATGIGVTTPTAELDVQGQNTQAWPATTGTSQPGLIARLRGSSAWSLDVGGDSTTFWMQSTYPGGLSNAGPLALNPNGSYVGIGTTTPSGMLDVEKPIGFGNTNIYLNSGGAVDIGTTATAGTVLNGGTLSGLVPYSAALPVSITGTLINVGASIGTTTSSYIGLNLENSSQVNGTYAPFLSFSGVSANASYNMPYAAIGAQRTSAVGSWNGGDLVFGVSPVGGGAVTERMRIASAGNVGIGTAAPANLLDVKGSMAVGTYAGTATGANNELIVGGNLGIGLTAPNQPLSVGQATIPTTVTVTGSTSPAFAGTYTMSGIWNGRNYWQGSPGYIWYGGNNWFISPSLGVQSNDFYSGGTGASPPTTSAWNSQGPTGSPTTAASGSTTSPAYGALTVDNTGDLTTTGLVSLGTTLVGSGASASVLQAGTLSGAQYYSGFYTSLTNLGSPLVNIGTGITSPSSFYVGLNLENSSTTNGTYSPLIAFSGLSGNSGYSMPFATIGGQRTGASGSWNAGDLVFTTGASNSVVERMRILSTGPVGVGATGPANTLDVGGSLAVGGFAGTATGAANQLIVSGNVGIGVANPSQALSIGTMPAGSTIVVGNSGSPNVSGSYTVAGTYGGRNYWQNGSGGYIFWYASSYWVIGTSLGTFTNCYYIGSASTTPPISGAWTAYSGATGTASTSSTNGSPFTVDANGDVVANGMASIGTTNVSEALVLEGGTVSNLSPYTSALAGSSFGAGSTLMDIGTSVAASTFTIGLDLENSSQINNSYSPFISFSRKSDDAGYNMPYAAIGAERIGQGGNTSFNAGDLVFFTNSVSAPYMYERMRLTSGGKIGIGIPASNAAIGSTLISSAWPATSGTTQSTGLIERLNDGSGMVLDIGGNAGSGAWMQVTNYSAGFNNNYPLILNPNGGNVSIGTTASSYLLQVGSATASGIVAEFINSAGACTFTPGASSMTPSCSSDVRLKKDIVEAGDALTWFNDMDVRDFTIKATGDRKTGVIAQELLKTHPDMVHMGPDGFYKVDEPNPWKFVKAIQMLKALFESDHDDIAKIKADNENLRSANDNQVKAIDELRQEFEAYKKAHP